MTNDPDLRNLGSELVHLFTKYRIPSVDYFGLSIRFADPGFGHASVAWHYSFLKTALSDDLADRIDFDAMSIELALLLENLGLPITEIDLSMGISHDQFDRLAKNEPRLLAERGQALRKVGQSEGDVRWHIQVLRLRSPDELSPGATISGRSKASKKRASGRSKPSPKTGKPLPKTRKAPRRGV